LKSPISFNTNESQPTDLVNTAILTDSSQSPKNSAYCIAFNNLKYHILELLGQEVMKFWV